MKRFDQQWRKLTALARQARDESDVTLPVGFATRVAARATSEGIGSAPWALLERLALRGLLVAAVCSAAAVAFNYFGSPSDVAYDSDIDQTLAVMLDLS